MTVQGMLGSMSQKELITWIAYHKLAREEDERQSGANAKTEQKPETRVAVKQPSQKQKDDLLLQQMFALVQAGKKKKRNR